MNLQEEIIKAKEDEVKNIISNNVCKANETCEKVEHLGFASGKYVTIFKGFIPLNARIKYSNCAMETYSMQTTDFFYEFADFLRKNNIVEKKDLIFKLFDFINEYFGVDGKGGSRQFIFNEIAWATTTTDEEYFEALENNKIGDLKGQGVAECTERSAVAQQILSLFGIESYYCIGCVDYNGVQEPHCYNIVKRWNDYVLVDYSCPSYKYTKQGKFIGFNPYVARLTNDEVATFLKGGAVKKLKEYIYLDDECYGLKDKYRYYVASEYSISKQKNDEQLCKC